MKKVIVNKKTIICLVLSAIIPLFIFLSATAVSGMLPGQKCYFLYGDSVCQYSIIPRAFFRRLFYGEDLTYSFRNGLGMPTVALNAFYSLSPFNVIYVCVQDLELAGLCVVCLKLMCASLSMCILLRTVIKSKGGISVLLSTAYSLCSFFSAFYVAVAFLDMLYVLPVIVLLVARFVRTGKWGALCLGYSYSFIIQFYTAYMTGVFSAVIFLAYAWYCYGKTYEKWKKAIRSFVICVLIAVMIAMPILLPTASELFSMHNSDAGEISDFSISLRNVLVGLFPIQTSGVYNTFPLMFAGVPVLLLGTIFFVNTKRKTREKILAVLPLLFLVLCLTIKPLYLFMHAFDLPTGYAFRFSWMVDFCLILMAARELNEGKNNDISRPVQWVSGGVWIFIFCCLYISQNFLADKSFSISLSTVLAVSGLIIFYVLIYGRDNRKGRISLLWGAVLISELWFGVVQRQTYIKMGNPERNTYDIWEQQAETSLEMVKTEEIKDPWKFYRVSYTNSFSDNISMLYEYNGLGWFASVEEVTVRNALKNLGFYTSALLVSDYGSTPLMQMLLAQKYKVECGFFLGNHPYDFTVRKNELTLPLGYMVSESIEDYSSQGRDPFEAQNSLVSAMCGKKHTVYEQQDNYGIELDGVDLAWETEGYRLTFPRKDGSAVYSFESDRDADVYAYMGRWGISEKHEEYPRVFSNMDVGNMMWWSRMGTPHIIPVRRDTDGLYRLIVSGENEEDNEIFDYEYLHFAYENTEEVAQVYRELATGAMNVTEFSDEKITGNVHVDSEKRVLFTSIPYSKNWMVYVDGIRCDTIAVVEGAFMGVKLTEGDHSVVFVYKSKWVEYGRLIGIIGVCLYAVIHIILKKKVLSGQRGMETIKGIDTDE